VSSSAVENEPPARPRSTTRAWASAAIKFALTALVLYAVGRHSIRTWNDLRSKGEFVQVAVVPFVGAVFLYLAGLVSFGLFYWRVMRASPTPIAPYAAIRAYLISHLGKYVPGKALVVIVRAGLSTPYGARPATAAFASMYETLLMMAAGGLIAGLAFGWGASARVPLPFGAGRVLMLPLPLIGLGLGALFLIVVEPSVFPRLARLARLPFPGVGPDALPTFSHRLLIEGLLFSTLGWTLLGLSQVAVLAAILPGDLPTSAWATVIASVALATVAGFAIPISPGGLGVREWVLWTALAAVIDRDHAVVAALVLRLAWVLGEILAAAVVSVIRPGAGASPR